MLYSDMDRLQARDIGERKPNDSTSILSVPLILTIERGHIGFSYLPRPLNLPLDPRRTPNL